MKFLIITISILLLTCFNYPQQASDYFPPQTGFLWDYSSTPLDSVNNPVNELMVFRRDSFNVVADYQGRSANIVTSKTGSLETIYNQSYTDSLFYSTSGTEAFEYFSISNIEPFLVVLDSMGIDTNFNFVDFFSSFQNWYSVYRFASPVGTRYTLLTQDTTIATYNLRFQYSAVRRSDETISTILGDMNCKKFLVEWTIFSFLGPFPVQLINLPDTVWVAPGNWIVQDVIPTQHIDLSLLGIPPFSLYGRKIVLTDQIIPVELTNLTASVNNHDVILNWTTVTELNNLGFEIQRSGGLIQNSLSKNWEKIGFVEGMGITTEIQNYTYYDNSLEPGSYQYRIKQIDLNGNSKYYNFAEIIEIKLLKEFYISQNYPNPFNPNTMIRWFSEINSHQVLKVFDVLGNEVTTLVNEYKPAGSYEVEFDASGLSSGIYFYQLKTGNFIQTKKMVLLR